jgi:hypothetical protein
MVAALVRSSFDFIVKLELPIIIKPVLPFFWGLRCGHGGGNGKTRRWTK